MLTKTLHTIEKIDNVVAKLGERRVWLVPTNIRENENRKIDLMSKHEKHILREVKTVEKMIRLYCAGKDHCRENDLCVECNELLEYALDRIDKCPAREEKVFCSECEIHCYRDDMRDKIRTVMRYSGPRMLLHNPIMAVSHLISTKHKARYKR